jgi:hypothetical protein
MIGWTKFGSTVTRTGMVALVLAALLAFMTYHFIDQADALEDSHQQNQHLSNQLAALKLIAENTTIGQTSEQMTSFLKKQDVEFFMKGENEVVAGEVEFIFSKGRLVRIDAK